MVLPSTRVALVAVLLDWRNNGSAPTVLVFAQTFPLELAGFDSVLCSSDFLDSGSVEADDWLWATLQHRAPWVVLSADLLALKADLMLKVNATQQLLDVNHRAQVERLK